MTLRSPLPSAKTSRQTAPSRSGRPGTTARDRLGGCFRLLGASLRSVLWPYFLVALCFAATLWYGLTVRDKVETWVDVRLEYRGMPADLVTRSRPEDKVAVRILAARGISRSLSSRLYSIPIDLSGVVKGVNTLPLDESLLPFTGAYEILEITPARIQVNADTREVREMAVDAAFSGALAQDFYITSLDIAPESVTVKGAESLVGAVSRITVTVPLSPAMPLGLTEVQAPVHLPEGVTAEPQDVAVSLTVGVRTRSVRVLREVNLAIPQGRKVKISPARISIQAELPASIAGENAALEAITAMAELPAASLVPDVAASLPVRVLLPENATLTSVTPSEVSVTLLPVETPAGMDHRRHSDF